MKILREDDTKIKIQVVSDFGMTLELYVMDDNGVENKNMALNRNIINLI